MIFPKHITDFGRCYRALEEFALFCMLCSGMKSDKCAVGLDNWLRSLNATKYAGPFAAIAAWITLHDKHGNSETLLGEAFREYGFRWHNQKAKRLIAFMRLCTLHLRTCTEAELNALPGFGLKATKFFILHSRADQRVAVIDTHILKHLKRHGTPNVPASTPTSKKEYRRLEDAFLKLYDAANSYRGGGMSVSQYDLALWNEYAAKST